MEIYRLWEKVSLYIYNINATNYNIIQEVIYIPIINHL